MNKLIIMKDKLTLEHRLQSMVDYCNKKKINKSNIIFQNYLSDSLLRYIHSMKPISIEKTFEIINCVKLFYFNKEYQNTYNNFIDKFSLVVNETNRLLLIKCICILHYPSTSINNIIDHKS